MSKGFSMIDGDVLVSKTIEMTDGKELLRQKVERVIGTNLGEWQYDLQEGIDFSLILRKNYDENEIRATIERALVHIDETFALTGFNLEVDQKRHATITYTAVNGAGIEIGGTYTYAY